MILYGKNSVLERLKTYPASIKRVLLQERSGRKEIQRLCAMQKVPVEIVSSEKLHRFKQVKGLQGVVAEVEEYTYASFDVVLSTGATLLCLDRISDPQNLGAIIRTAACLGGFAVVLPKHEACQITETVLHVASGGENYVPVAQVAGLANALTKAKRYGYWVAGTVIDEDAQTLRQCSFPVPLAVVLGFEGEGIRQGVAKQLDMNVSIPMPGVALSFNVAIACAILCYEVSSQRI